MDWVAESCGLAWRLGLVMFLCRVVRVLAVAMVRLGWVIPLYGFSLYNVVPKEKIDSGIALACNIS